MPTTAEAPQTADRTQRLHNFAAGPATLPEEVLLEAQDELPVYDEAGASVMEISHRSDTYDDVEESARRRIKELLGAGDEWNVLFLQGGASMQFHQAPLNYLGDGRSVDYLITGRWGKKAIKEAQIVADEHGGGVREAGRGESETGFTYIPDRNEWDLNPDAAYLHYTSNNTVAGTQFHETPQADAPLVCDASSDFLSRPLDLDPFGIIYAGAQKNVGPAGVTIVLIKDSFLEQRRQPLPTMLDYGTHVRKRFNTPPAFPIYMVEKVMRWLQDLGGLEAIAERNDRKAKLLYDRIDQTDFYEGVVEPEARSMMNVTFRIADHSLEDEFIEEAERNGLLTLSGHRTVGGLRASIYNACPVESIKALVRFMDEFERTRG